MISGAYGEVKADCPHLHLAVKWDSYQFHHFMLIIFRVLVEQLLVALNIEYKNERLKSNKKHLPFVAGLMHHHGDERAWLQRLCLGWGYSHDRLLPPSQVQAVCEQVWQDPLVVRTLFRKNFLQNFLTKKRTSWISNNNTRVNTKIFSSNI